MGSSWASNERSRRTMVANRHRDTQPELRVRRILHAAGLRYRVDTRPVAEIRCRADVIFSRRRIAVFIDGCFWHSCPVHGVAPKSNSGYWGPKLAGNRSRDARMTNALVMHGWTVMRFWEHEDPEAVAQAILSAWRD
ncbi:very short patch repair endonuclease [Paramicrobacterium fandaimingii]|uniref:very short patch repair endonuclease n=1 Tax=Paramicrobacterium fandaimingii TaxID=2708079 RepID=UPI00142236EB|nr:very short patch repair endonuclease [Microbacterium fandaimingii]